SPNNRAEGRRSYRSGRLAAMVSPNNRAEGRRSYRSGRLAAMVLPLPAQRKQQLTKHFMIRLKLQ
ncbi:MAG: hypothetical protein WBN51_07910, partial [Gammaproteobacteria bacterium]